MTDKTEAQPEALELADRLMGNAQIDECEGCNPLVIALERAAAAELRRLHAEIQQFKAQLSARQAAPDGWRLVPESPTEEMLDAAHASDCEYSKRAFGGRMHMPQAAEDHWHVMLSAAPPPPDRDPLKGGK
ncbi:hypothetical protein ACCQ08_14960 [Comamonas sp. SY3]|uniref:hypothetical protein n=1 Tax=Comamonas sp. SY3 TaxID=3243601 RepID=UPI0035948DDD